MSRVSVEGTMPTTLPEDIRGRLIAALAHLLVIDYRRSEDQAPAEDSGEAA